MAISDKDIKLLWGKAAACCSAPNCHVQLAMQTVDGGNATLGEMAHIVGREPTAARADAAIGVDDSYRNRILLCPSDHTRIDNDPDKYPVTLLSKWKADWESTVATRVAKIATESGKSPDLEFRLWSYFNFDRILDLYKTYVATPQPDTLALLQSHGMVNSDGFPLLGPEPDNQRTIFNSWPQGQSRTLRDHFGSMVDKIVVACPPINLNPIWEPTSLQSTITSGAIVFLNRGFHFKTTATFADYEERRVRASTKGVELVFQIDTRNIYGSSAYNLHFTANNSAAAFLLVRSILPKTDKSKVKLEIKATPIALGTGFWKLS